MGKREQIISFLNQETNLSEIGRRVGTSREYVRQVKVIHSQGAKHGWVFWKYEEIDG